MNSRPESTGDANRRHPKRLRVDALERLAQTMVARGAPPPGALAIGLQRSDRIRALAGRPDSFEVLATLLDRVEQALRPDDRYAVVSVSEIWVLLADAAGDAIVRLRAAGLRERINGVYAGRSDEGLRASVLIGASVGGAWIGEWPATAADLVASASRALGEARRSEDRIAVVCALEDRGAERSRLEERIRHAIDHGELEVWFQPQVRLQGGQRCESVEALIRWPRQDDGSRPIGPQQVVSVCEETGMIADLTRYVLHSALRHLMAWNAVGLRLTVGVNLSALTLEDASFPDQVAQACATWDVAPSQLLFELTEGSIARNEQTTLDFMHQLRQLGCSLSIDDFGTGYSSFAYLRQFPVNELKIDREFVRELPSRPADRAIARVLIEIAHAFGLQALAEGVEDAESVRILTELGCDAIQGWHFAKAMRGEEIAPWLRAFEADRPKTEALPAMA
jgi:EAL domain-containing protein (putative c-di-GMP-specific phosphodiesterase class I)